MRNRIGCSAPRVLLAFTMAMVGLRSHRLGAAVGGRIVLDRNGNGLADAGEPGVSGVAVSDGRRVVVSDAQGVYLLERPPGDVLLRLTVPRDHAVAAGFWRRGDGVRREDFLLTSRPQPESFTFVQVTDAHVGRLDLFKRFVERMNAFPVPLAFVVHTGDLVGGVDVVPVKKAKEQFDRYLEGAALFRVPLFNLPGNHEHTAFQVKDADRTHPDYGKGLYRRLFGPMHYSWNWGPYHFIALDGTRLPYQEKLGDEQCAWLREDLAVTPVDTPIVLFCHQSVSTLRDAAALLEALKGRKVLAAFCGHLHETSRRKLGDIPVYQTGALAGSWWSGANPDGSPQGFAVVKLTGDRVDTVYTGREGTHSLYVSKPSVSAVQSGHIEVETVVLDFGKAVNVSAAFGGKTLALTRTAREPFWSVWSGRLDTTTVPDGLAAVTVTAGLGAEISRTRADYVIINGREGPREATADAVLKMGVRGVEADNEVWLNGTALGVLPGGTPNNTTLAFPIPAARLRRLNRVLLRSIANPGDPNKDDFNVGPIWLEYAGKRYHDLRFVSFARHQIGDNNPKGYPAEKEFYLCLP